MTVRCLTGKPRLPPHLPRGQFLHDLFRAAADGIDLHLAVDALHLGAAHEANAAVDLHGSDPRCLACAAASILNASGT